MACLGALGGKGRWMVAVMLAGESAVIGGRAGGWGSTKHDGGGDQRKGRAGWVDDQSNGQALLLCG